MGETDGECCQCVARCFGTGLRRTTGVRIAGRAAHLTTSWAGQARKRSPEPVIPVGRCVEEVELSGIATTTESCIDVKDRTGAGMTWNVTPRHPGGPRPASGGHRQLAASVLRVPPRNLVRSVGGIDAER